ncbi:hypothetical protein N7490_001291 [Penicillium lividum]|nr:hypothetical protein N7490_001291 [Penicillium lividum]
MAPIKRKGNAPEETATRQPQKRAKVGAEEFKDQKPKDTAPKASELSVLRDDEPSFPRGGASVLTPLERKQIQIQATKDVLFEQKGTKGPKKPTRQLDDENDDEDEDDEMEDGETTTPAKKSRKKKTKGKKSDDTEKSEKGVRIESLSFKHVVAGSMILGQITSINAHEISVSLPNNLVGFVPLTSVSKVLDDKIEKLLNDEGSDDEDSSDEDSIDLKDYFYIGQYLRTYVVSTGTEATEAGVRSKKRIELSIDPRQANTGLSTSDLVVESAVQASVVSVEDHGLVMDLGIEGADLKGFMSSKEVDPRVDYHSIKEGSVYLCMVTGKNSSGNVIKLSTNLQSAASIKKSHFLSAAPTIGTFLPGVAAEILLTEVTENGLMGKIMGMLDATVDLVQSGANDGKVDLVRKYKMGAKIKGRIISTFPSAEPFKVGFSILDHVLRLSSESYGPGSSPDAPAISAIVPEAKVIKVDPGMGVYVQIGETKHIGFVHISRLSDGKVESISNDEGAFQVGATHEARIVGYNTVDNLYLLSFEKTVIEQPFLRLEDVTVGAIVKGKVDKILIGPTGMDGLIVGLADGISGLVPSMHFADSQLQHPEKKFREDMKISARILSVNLEKRQIRLTLKKSLLNSESAIWKDYKDILAGAQSPGTIVNIQAHGAVVQFYGTIRGFLPVSEMSEAYIKDPTQHFKLGQVVNVHALSVDASQGRLAVSCKDPSTFTDKYRKAFEDIHPGLLVAGTVFEKTNDDLLLKLDESGLVARLDVQHIIDGSPSKQSSTLSKIRVGQKLNDLMVLDIKRAHRLIRVTARASLKKASKQKSMPSKFTDLKERTAVTGFVRNITPAGLFVEFLGGLTGLVPKRLIEDANLSQVEFGVSRGQTITVTVHSVESDVQRFILSQKSAESTESAKKTKTLNQPEIALENPVDETVKIISDLTFGRLVKCKVVSIKHTQLNVQLADNIQGRIDVSEVYDKWEDLKDRKQPLRFFKAKQDLSARILGVHDARNHKFLPISHRSGKYPVFELSLKPSFLKAANPEPLNMENVKVGSSWMGFVNNVAEDSLWINLSPNVRGRLRFMDASDDLSLLTDVEKNFPIGSALKVQVTAVNADKGHLDLSAKQGIDKLSFNDISVGMILPGRVTKVTEKQVIMQLNDALVGAVDMLDLADDYSKANPTVHQKNEVLRACVVAVDKAHKKIYLSLRPSKVMSSSLPVQDREISSIKDLKPNDVVRGFVKRVADSGLFVAVGHDVTAYVRVSDLSDSYLKEWKDAFQVDQLVKGRVIVADAEQGKLQISLKESVLDPNFKALITLQDLKVGQIVTGKVRKVEEFGAFVVVDGSKNVSGLCHRSEMADKRVEDARKLYDAGDVVKAKVIKIDSEQGKVSFSLKASHFQDEESEDEDMSDDAGGVELEDASDDDDVSMGGVDVEDDSEEDEDEDEDDEIDSDEDVAMSGTKPSKVGGLGTSGFDWSGKAQDATEAANTDSDDEGSKKKKKKNRKAEIQIDRTGDLDANGPQSVADYERLLLGESDSSLLWLQYMAFQLELGEVEKARTIAERALRTITMGQDSEKLNIWVALLNMENTYGDDDSLEEVFKRACQFNDPQEIYERMISIYIQSGKNEKADDLFRTAMKKKISNQSPRFFLNYATFLFDTLAAPDRGRGLLGRALQSLPPHTHVETTSKFAQLEFRSPNGDSERGRTVFEGLLSSFPKRIDLWNVLLDLEISAGDAEQVRRLFERVLGLQNKKGVISVDASKKLKPKQAKFLFKKWLAYEETLASANGNEKIVEDIKARAAAYVKSLQE